MRRRSRDTRGLGIPQATLAQSESLACNHPTRVEFVRGKDTTCWLYQSRITTRHTKVLGSGTGCAFASKRVSTAVAALIRNVDVELQVFSLSRFLKRVREQEAHALRLTVYRP